MKKSYISVITLAVLMVFAYATNWSIPLKSAVVVNALLIFTNCIKKILKATGITK